MPNSRHNFLGTIGMLPGALALATAPALAQQKWQQDFETAADGYFEPLRGKASAGSTIEISTERSYSTRKAAKLTYKFSDRGFVTPHIMQRPVVATTEDRLYFSAWVYGSGRQDFTSARLRLIDAGGEVFQYQISAAMVPALNGTGWRQATSEIDLSKPTDSFGSKKNGVRELPLKFLGFGFTHDVTKVAEGTLFLDDIVLSDTAPETAKVAVTGKKKPLELELVPAGDSPQLYIYLPGASATARLVSNQPPTAGRTPHSVRWTARNYSGQVIAEGRQPLDAAGRGEFKLAAPQTGIVYVHATLMGAGDEALGDAETRFAVLRPHPIPESVQATGDPLLFGVATHLQRENGIEAEREVALMSALGFRACRMDLSWSQVQPARDQWRWETFDHIFKLFEQHRIAPAPILGFSTRWATTGDLQAKDWKDWSMAPPVTEDFVHFTREAVGRYGRTVKHWEIWNEADISFWRGTVEQYAMLFDASSKAIRETDPTAKVLNGGWSQTRRRPDFIPNWHRLVSTKPDIYTYHSHNSFANLIRASEEVKQYKALTNWTMPTWLNEAGFTSYGTISEQTQARILAKRMSYAPALGFDGYFWYDLRNDGVEQSEAEHNYGLVRRDFTPKAAAVAAHTLIGTLAGQRFVRRIEVPGTANAYALLFERPDASGGSLVLWNEADATVPLFWRVPTSATRISLMGEKEKLPGANGLISLAATPEPQFLTFFGPAAQFQPAPRLLDFESPIIAGPNETVPVRLTIRNPLSQPLQGNLQLTPSGGWKVASPVITYNLPANGSREWQIQATAPSTLTGPQHLDISLSSPGLPTGALAQIRLQTALVVPRLTAASEDLPPQPLAVLGQNNLVSLYEATPMQELLFKGDADLSARINMVRQPNGLRFTVRVRDDNFVQKENVTEAWRGDSLQWGLALPGGEHYEWLAALMPEGPIVVLNDGPPGTPRSRLEIPAKIRREGDETIYDITFSTPLPGNRELPDRFTFNFLVNDNDGAGRKGWIEWTPGIGRNKSTSQYQPLVVK